MFSAAWHTSNDSYCMMQSSHVEWTLPKEPAHALVQNGLACNNGLMDGETLSSGSANHLSFLEKLPNAHPPFPIPILCDFKGSVDFSGPSSFHTLHLKSNSSPTAASSISMRRPVAVDRHLLP
jgi:hypothetical protein